MAVVGIVLYFMFGVCACAYLYATWDGWTFERQERLEQVGCFLVAVPEAGILVCVLVIFFWPVYVLLRVVRFVLK